MSTTTTTPYEVDECRGVLCVYSDGLIIRSPNPSFNVPVHDDGSMLWRDTLFHPANNLYLHLYKPSTPTTSKKPPIIFYVHGGGFYIGSRTWPNCQNYCFLLSSQHHAIFIASDYSLPSEHRLPAAINDAFTSLKWLQDQSLSENCGEWLSESADFDRVFISRDPAGGNIVHDMAVKLGVGSPSLAPSRIRGYVLLAPFYGGTMLMKSESEGTLDAFLNWHINITTQVNARGQCLHHKPYDLESP